MRVHILGICGTFMSGIATLARSLGHTVTGQDRAALPPISTLLDEQGIQYTVGDDVTPDLEAADLVIIGNTLSRGSPVIEYVFDHNKPFTSGPEWLHRHVLSQKRCICVSGTHGKTTTTAMIAHILEQAGLKPSFLIAGEAKDFDCNARLGDGDWFVLEGDEYDTAFFDKRPKFLHYFPEVVLINNLEFDHADIYKDLAEIQTQFHYLMRTVPSHGLVVYPGGSPAIESVLQRGSWSSTVATGRRQDEWHLADHTDTFGQWTACHNDRPVGTVDWKLVGQHNVANALNALACVKQVGVEAETALEALSSFKGVTRRMEHIASLDGFEVYDDFAHHPTAIHSGLTSIRSLHPEHKLVVVLELGSYTLRHGLMLKQLSRALGLADQVWVLNPSRGRADDNPVAFLEKDCPTPITELENIDNLVKAVAEGIDAPSAIVLMSSRGLNTIHSQLVDTLTNLR